MDKGTSELGQKARKVRTGCITCRARKVKCDENKPSCRRCVRSRRTCEGYRVLVPSTSLRGHLRSTPDFDSPEEAFYFVRFLELTGKILAGETNDRFWDDLVIRLSLSEPAIKHAIVAISGLYQRVDADSLHKRGHQQGSSPGDGKDETFPLAQYCKAISAVRLRQAGTKIDEGEHTVVILSLCVLLVCIEFLRGDDRAAQLHINHGRFILSTFPDKGLSVTTTIKEHLVPIYSRFSLASLFVGHRPAPIPPFLRKAGSDTTVLQGFDSLDTARNALYHLIDDGLDLTADVKRSESPEGSHPGTSISERKDLEEKQQYLILRLEEWAVLFAGCLAHRQKDKERQDQFVTPYLLQLYYHVCQVWVSTVLSPSELTFDQHVSSFSSIVAMGATIADMNGSSPDGCRPFTFETELLAPLYWTSLKCRHPVLRRAALALMQREELVQCHENLWQARFLVAVASRVMAVEEAGMEDSLRMKQVLVDPQQSGGIWLTMIKDKHIGDQAQPKVFREFLGF